LLIDLSKEKVFACPSIAANYSEFSKNRMMTGRILESKNNQKNQKSAIKAD